MVTVNKIFTYDFVGNPSFSESKLVLNEDIILKERVLKIEILKEKMLLLNKPKRGPLSPPTIVNSFDEYKKVFGDTNNYFLLEKRKKKINKLLKKLK